jgi:hypothetical protein
MAQQHALATVDPASILDRIANGEYAAHIARDLGVTKQSLHRKIRELPDYPQAREIGCEVRLDDCLAEFEDVDTKAETAMADLARARERFKAVAWHAEREFPHRWGQRSEVHTITESYSDALRRISERNLAMSVAPEQQENSLLRTTHVMLNPECGSDDTVSTHAAQAEDGKAGE